MTQAFNLSQLANNVNTTGQLNAAAGLYNQTPVANGGTGLSTATGALVGAGSTISAIAAGTAGNVLTSDGTTWTSAVSAGGPAPVVRIYTSPSPWTKSPTVKGVKVTLVSGGGSAAGGSGGSTSGGGGGGGGMGFFPAPSIPGPVTVTVGTGGSPVTPSISGNSGTSSSFGALITATGGGAGVLVTPSTNTASGGAGGSITPSPTVFGTPGQSGEPSVASGANGGNAYGGFGYAGRIGFQFSLVNGTGYGGGGATTRNTSFASGSGANGFVIVEEFY